LIIFERFINLAFDAMVCIKLTKINDLL